MPPDPSKTKATLLGVAKHAAGLEPIVEALVRPAAELADGYCEPDVHRCTGRREVDG